MKDNTIDKIVEIVNNLTEEHQIGLLEFLRAYFEQSEDCQ